MHEYIKHCQNIGQVLIFKTEVKSQLSKILIPFPIAFFLF